MLNMFAPWSFGGERIRFISHSTSTEFAVKAVSHSSEISEELLEIESEVEDYNMVLDYNSKQEQAQEINDIYRLSFLEIHGGQFYSIVVGVIMVFVAIFLYWLCTRKSVRQWRKGCCPCGETPAVENTTAVEMQLLELKEMMKSSQDVQVALHASRTPIIRGGVASAPPSEGGKVTLEDLGNFKQMRMKVRQEREDLINEELGGVMK